MTIHVMLDLETWGKKPGCDLRSIGATVFDPITGTVGKECRACNGGRGPGNVNDGGDCSDCLNTRTDHAGEFYIATDNPDVGVGAGFYTDEGVYRKYPLTRDPGTVQWWNDQSAQAQAAFTNPVDLEDALIDFNAWIMGIVGVDCLPDHGIKDLCVWAHGPSFDVSIIEAAYAAVGQLVPWHYRAPRDTRTAFDMAGVGDHSTFMQQFNHGTAHNALDDAISQARCVNAAWAIVRGWRHGPMICNPDSHLWISGAEGGFAGLTEHCSKCGLER